MAAPAVPTMDTRAEARDFLATLRAQRVELAESLAREERGRALVLHNHVVMQHGMGLQYDIDNGVASNPRLVGIIHAPRFSKVDATTLAAATFDGAGRTATAVPVRQALQIALADADGLIEALSSKLEGGAA